MKMHNLNSEQGASLLELVVFIVIVGMIAVAVSDALLIALRGGQDIQEKQTATEYAQIRLELIHGQKILHGFSNFDDPCDSSPSLQICDSGNYTITSTINSWHDNGWPGSSSDYKKITVTADDSSGDQLAEVSEIVSDSPPN